MASKASKHAFASEGGICLKAPRVVAKAFAVLMLTMSVAPSASAAFGFGETRIDISDSQVGDLAHYERTYFSWNGSGEGKPVNATLLVLAEGAATAYDKFGILRATDAYRADFAWDGNYSLSQRCHALRGGVEPVRMDVLAGARFSLSTGTGGGVLPLETSSAASYITRALFDESCASRNPLGGRTLREGETLMLGLAVGHAYELPALRETSGPAVATKFHGRDALSFTFAAVEGDGKLILTFADGLPGVVRANATGLGRVGVEWGIADTDQRPLVMELVGLERGQGEKLSRWDGSTLPAAHPSAVPERYQPLRLDDSAFAFPYRFADALAALVADPSLCVGAFVRDHPDAYLQWIEYDRAARDPLVSEVETDGAWTLRLRAAGASCEGETIRMRPQGSVVAPVRNYGDAQSSARNEPIPDVLPDALVPIAHLMTVAATSDAPIAETQWLAFRINREDDGAASASFEVASIPMFGLHEAGRFSGWRLTFDPSLGALTHVRAGEADVQKNIKLDPDAATLRTLPPTGDTFAALNAPERGQNLTTGLVGIALLAALLKWGILPFYTRLRRAALLDHPVRRTILDTARNEPGAHQTRLVEAAAVGKGAAVRHIDRLVHFGYLVEMRETGYTRYYVAGAVPRHEARRTAVLRHDTTRRVYELLSSEPTLSLREIAARLGVSAPSVHRIKKRLEKEGLHPAAKAGEDGAEA